MRCRNLLGPVKGLAIFLVLALGLSLPGLVFAAESTIVSVSAPSQVGTGETFTVSIEVEPHTAIAGAQFNLSFDPSLVTVSNVEEGDLLTQDGASTYFNPGDIDNVAGTISGVAGVIISPGQTVSTPGTLAVITLTAGTGGGTCPLTLSGVVVGDINGNSVPVSVVNGGVTINANQPVLAPIGDKSVNEGQLLTFTISATDPNGDPLTYSASNLPQGASFDSQTQTFSWTPSSGQAGVYPDVHFEVSDGELSDSEDITITVNTASPPPGGGGGGIGTGGDRTPPRIYDIVVSETTETSVDICWTTNEWSTSQVDYWASPSWFSYLDEATVIKHKIHLTDLNVGTTYHFKVMSMDRAGNLAVSDEHTLTTLGAPAAFSVSALDITPAEVDIGEGVTISVVVTNTGNAAGSYGVTLKIDGMVEATKEVTIDAGASQVVSFTIARDKVGMHRVDANGMSGSFTVNERGALEIGVFSVTPYYDTETHRLIFAKVIYEVNNFHEPMADVELILEVRLDGVLVEEVSLLSTSQLELGGTTGSRDYIARGGWKSGIYTFQGKLYVGGELYTSTVEEELEVTAESTPAVVSWAVLGLIIGAMLGVITVTIWEILRRRRRIFGA